MNEKSSQSEARRTVLLSSLRQCRLFSDLSPEELDAVAETCSTQHLKKGEYLFREEEKALGFYVVQSGSINVHRVTPDGREQVIAVFRPFDPFAEVTLTTLETYPADAVALEQSTVILVKRNEFRKLILNNPDLSLRMLTSMSFHLKYLVQMIEDLKFKQIEARLAHYLNRQREESKGHEHGVVRLDLAKRVLASQLGVTSETLSRTLAKFREEGLIRVDGPQIEITDRAGLVAYVEGRRS